MLKVPHVKHQVEFEYLDLGMVHIYHTLIVLPSNTQTELSFASTSQKCLQNHHF